MTSNNTINNTEAFNPNGYSRINTLADLLNVNHQTITKWYKQNKFPRPHNMNGILLFKNSDILRWLEQNGGV